MPAILNQDGDFHHLENHFFDHNSSTDCAISAKLCTRNWEAARHADKGHVTKTANFQNPRWRRPPFWKSLNHHILVKILSDFDKIWCTIADIEPDEILKSAIKYRVIFKTATIMHQTSHRRCPSYLSDLIVFASADLNVRQLCSSTTPVAAVKRSRAQFGRRAFSVAGPDIWNSLPATIHTIDYHPAFHHALKTHLFCSAFEY